MKHPVRVTFQPEGRTVYVMKNTLLIEAAGEAGIGLNQPCGGKGVCGKCRVRFTRGAPSPTSECEKHLSPAEIAEGFRLACQARITEDSVVDIPATSRFFAQKILTTGEGQAVALDPNVRKRFLKLPEPSLADPRSDEDRMLDGLGLGDGVKIGLDVLRELPEALRRNRYSLTAVLRDNEVIALEDGDTSGRICGMAFDIGTTTVVGLLHDLTTGKELGVACRTNPQVAYGDDVVSRINYASTNQRGLARLHDTIVDCLNEIVAEACVAAGVLPEHIYEVTVVGNTTMSHLFLGVPPTFVAQSPYVAAMRRGVDVPASVLGLRVNSDANVHVFPNVAGFVGGDTVGVILACDLIHSKEVRLAIDIGTNGELVLGSRERLVSCSTAAGPAFEGARIRFGMRATEGAIDKIHFNDDVQLNVIGNVPARGLCGTALIDAVAELLRVGIVDPRGRLLGPEEIPSSVPERLRKRVIPGENGNSFVLAEAEECALDQPIVLTQRDIREVQLAKGAIAAGTRILLKELGVDVKDVKELYLAGAFGNFIRRSMAKRIGLLPPEMPTERITFVGNAAGAGARMALLSRKCREEAAEISERTEYLELAGRPDFQYEFMSAMMFPE